MKTVWIIFNHEGVDGSSCLVKGYNTHDEAFNEFERMENAGDIYAGEVVGVDINELLTPWISMQEKPLKQEEAMEVIGFHPSWIDPDFNPNGTRVGFIGGEGEFISSKWVDYQDCYTEDDTTTPTHYMYIPKHPLIGPFEPEPPNQVKLEL
jgi:hypothetical protein